MVLSSCCTIVPTTQYASVVPLTVKYRKGLPKKWQSYKVKTYDIRIIYLSQMATSFVGNNVYRPWKVLGAVIVKQFQSVDCR